MPTYDPSDHNCAHAEPRKPQEARPSSICDGIANDTIRSRPRSGRLAALSRPGRPRRCWKQSFKLAMPRSWSRARRGSTAGRRSNQEPRPWPCQTKQTSLAPVLQIDVGTIVRRRYQGIVRLLHGQARLCRRLRLRRSAILRAGHARQRACWHCGWSCEPVFVGDIRAARASALRCADRWDTAGRDQAPVPRLSGRRRAFPPDVAERALGCAELHCCRS